MRAAPPAVDRIVLAEVLLVRENSFSEFGERQPAAQVGSVPVAQIFAAKRAQFFVEACHGRSRTVRETIQQIAVFPFAEGARLPQIREMKERICKRISARDQFEHPHFRRAKSCRTRG